MAVEHREIIAALRLMADELESQPENNHSTRYEIGGSQTQKFECGLEIRAEVKGEREVWNVRS